MYSIHAGAVRVNLQEDCMAIDFTLPKWRLEERIANLMRKGHTREEAEAMVKNVITTKEGPHGNQ